jgi:hypothetical protein
VGASQCAPGGHSPIKPRRPVRSVRRAAKDTTSPDMENQPARHPHILTLSPIWVRVFRVRQWVGWIGPISGYSSDSQAASASRSMTSSRS